MAALYGAGATSAAASAASSVTWSHTVGIRPKKILLAWTAYIRAAGGRTEDRMKSTYKIAVLGILVIAVLEAFAISQGIDGTLFNVPPEEEGNEQPSRSSLANSELSN